MIITGFTALLVQIIYLREFLNVFSGNELVVGVIIGNWMLLTAAGARLAGLFTKGVSSTAKIISGQLFISVIIPVSGLAIYWAKATFYPPGSLPAFYGTSLLSLLIMAPFCLVSGGLFTFLSTGFSALAQKQQAQKVYGLEAIGSFLGGLLFTFVLLVYLTTFQTIFIVSAINVFAGLLLVSDKPYGKLKRSGMIIFIFILLIIPFTIDFDALSKSYVYKRQKIVLMKDTPFGSLVVTQAGNQYNFFENGVNLFSSDNVIANEESVHYAMLQHKNPQEVLVVSGDISGISGEILKYNVARIDYVEINPYLIKAIGDVVGFDKEMVNVHVSDARKYIFETQSKYDVVLLNLPPPANLQLNRFYTDEFFGRVKEILHPGGVVSIPVEGGSNYLGDEAIKLMGTLYNTLKLHFKNVILYPGEGNYFLASDDNLGHEILGKLEQKNIENEWVNRYYVDEGMAGNRAKSILRALDADQELNSDFNPVAYFTQISYWLSWYGQKIWWSLGVAILALALLFVFSGTFNKALLVTGFTASVVEMVVLLTFQIFFGHLYHAIALLISVFMVGLAAGVWVAEKYSFKATFLYFIVNQLLMGALALIFFLSIGKVSNFSIPELYLKTLFYLIMLVFGGMTGLQFTWVMTLRKGGRATVSSSAYAADLLGAAGGAILASILLVPTLGLPLTAFLLFGINLLIVLILFFKKTILR